MPDNVQCTCEVPETLWTERLFVIVPMSWKNSSLGRWSSARAQQNMFVWNSLWISSPCKPFPEKKINFCLHSQQLPSRKCFYPSLREAVAKCCNIPGFLSLKQREMQLCWHVFTSIVCTDYLQLLTVSSSPCLILPPNNSSRSSSLLLFSKRCRVPGHLSPGIVFLQFLLAHLHTQRNGDGAQVTQREWTQQTTPAPPRNSRQLHGPSWSIMGHPSTSWYSNLTVQMGATLHADSRAEKSPCLRAMWFQKGVWECLEDEQKAGNGRQCMRTRCPTHAFVWRVLSNRSRGVELRSSYFSVSETRESWDPGTATTKVSKHSCCRYL